MVWLIFDAGGLQLNLSDLKSLKPSKFDVAQAHHGLKTYKRGAQEKSHSQPAHWAQPRMEITVVVGVAVNDQNAK